MLEVMQVARDAAAIRMDNRAQGKERNRYSEIILAFNGSKEPCELALPEGKWDVLCDGENSFAHLRPRSTAGMMTMEPVSALILGKK